MTGAALPRVLRRDGYAAPRLPYFIGASLTGLFLLLVALVATGQTQAWDDALSLRLHGLATPGVVAVMRAFTFLGTHSGTAPVIVGVLALLVTRRRYDLALGFALLTVGAEGPVEWIKMLVDRPRPHLWASAYSASGYSFPSGHATYGVILPAALVILAWRHVGGRPGRTALLSFAAVFGGTIGFSRIILGVHYATDVMAGFALGGIWICLYLGPFRAAWRPQRTAAQVLGLGLALAIVVASRWINSPGFGPTTPEAFVDLICLALIGWGFCLRVAAHCLPRAIDRRAAPAAGPAMSHATCAGTFLLGCGLALMLHDAMVLGIFTLFFCLWWAAAAQGARESPVSAPAERQPGAAGRVCWRRQLLPSAVRQECAVLALSLFAAVMIERREWIPDPLALRAGAGLAAVLVALLVWLALRRGILRTETGSLQHTG